MNSSDAFSTSRDEPDSLTPLPRPLKPEEIISMSENILGQLRDKGFAYIKQRLTAACFEQVSRRLGVIELTTDLIINPAREQAQRTSRNDETRLSKRPTVYNPDEITFHTDRPGVNILAWYCLQQDQVDGSLLLIDTNDLPTFFSADELEALGRIPVNYTLRDSSDREDVLQEPLVLRNTRGGYDVYYAPWHLPENLSEQESRLVARFKTYIDHKQDRQLIKVRLAERESLFALNRRMLHGRGLLSGESRRHLIRFYIKASEANL